MRKIKEKIVAHGRTFEGVVVSSKSQKTVTVEWERRRFVPKYERYLKARPRIKAHNPESVSAEEGDIVRIKECRPISKTKSFIVIEKLGKNYIQLEKSHQELDPAKKIVEKKKDQKINEKKEEITDEKVEVRMEEKVEEKREETSEEDK